MSALSPETLKAEAQRRVHRALAHISNARNELDAACRELSALNYGAPVWRATGKLSDRVRAMWYRVDAFRQRGRYVLDSINVEALERRLIEADSRRLAEMTGAVQAEGRS